MSTTSRHSLLQLLEPVVSARGLDLEDVQVVPAGKRRLVRIVVDRDGGVSLDDVAGVSTTVSARLEESDAMGGGPYVLEVTSPGVDRPLTAPRHWRRARGRLVSVQLDDGSAVRGRVREADATTLTLDLDDDAGSARTLGWESVRDGRVQVEFSSGRRVEPSGPGDVEREA